MKTGWYQIRLCLSCGLRYPREQGNSSGARCPVCLAETQLIGTYPLKNESWTPFNDPSLHVEAILDNIRSAWNVGSIFRSADGFGLKHLYLCGITSTPESDAVRKTSLGAEDSVAWSYHKDAVLILRALHEQGYKTFALENDMKAISIKDVVLARRRRKSDVEKNPTDSKFAKKSASPRRIGSGDKIALILGNEVTGVDPDVLNMSDEIVFIPMRGDKRSFNVAVAFAIAVSQLAL